MSTLLKEIARVVFTTGRPLDDLIDELVRQEYIDALNYAKQFVRGGVSPDVVRDQLVKERNIPFGTALTIVADAEHQVTRERAISELERKANETAQTLYRNGCRIDHVTNALQAEGCTPDQALRIATENRHHAR